MAAERVEVPAGEEQAAINKAREARGEAAEEEKPAAEAEVEGKPEAEAGSGEGAEGDKSSDEPEGGEEGDGDAGQLFDTAFDQWMEYGEVPEETLGQIVEAVSGAGLTEQHVRTYIAGLEALRFQQEQAAFSVTGGEETYGQMIEWAKGSLQPAEIEAYNAALGGSPASAKLAIQGLFAQFQAAGGKAAAAAPKGEPSLRSTTARASGEGHGALKPIMSRAEFSKLTSDPRYQNDPAFQQEVQQRLELGMKSGQYNAGG